jgi:cytochrome P450
MSLGKPTTPPPGLRHLAPFGVTRAFRRDPLGFTMRLYREFGDVVSIRMGTRWAFYFFLPEDIKHVLQDNHQNYLKGRPAAKSKVFFGEGLFSSEGTVWRGQRRLLQPAFQRARIEAYVDAMAGCAEALLDRWDATRRDHEPTLAAGRRSRAGNLLICCVIGSTPR